MRHVPLIGDVAAGTGVLAAENIEETLPIPEDFTGDGVLFMLRVRGDSMIEAGIFDGDYVVVRQQPDAEPGDTVIAGIPGEEATVKTFLKRRNKIVLRPENSTMDEMVFDPADVTIYGKVVSLLRRSEAGQASTEASLDCPTSISNHITFSCGLDSVPQSAASARTRCRPLSAVVGRLPHVDHHLGGVVDHLDPHPIGVGPDPNPVLALRVQPALAASSPVSSSIARRSTATGATVSITKRRASATLASPAGISGPSCTGSMNSTFIHWWKHCSHRARRTCAGDPCDAVRVDGSGILKGYGSGSGP